MTCGWETAGAQAGPADTSAFQLTRRSSGISGGLERVTKAWQCSLPATKLQAEVGASEQASQST